MKTIRFVMFMYCMILFVVRYKPRMRKKKIQAVLGVVFILVLFANKMISKFLAHGFKRVLIVNSSQRWKFQKINF